jgi:hypothetical protein
MKTSTRRNVSTQWWRRSKPSDGQKSFGLKSRSKSSFLCCFRPSDELMMCSSRGSSVDISPFTRTGSMESMSTRPRRLSKESWSEFDFTRHHSAGSYQSVQNARGSRSPMTEPQRLQARPRRISISNASEQTTEQTSGFLDRAFENASAINLSDFDETSLEMD